jgi:Peptidase family M20/M25/M40
MKGGLVMNAFVLAAFKRFAPNVPLVALMTGDEEIGSATSRSIIEQEAQYALAVFNSEPGRAFAISSLLAPAVFAAAAWACDATVAAGRDGYSQGDQLVRFGVENIAFSCRRLQFMEGTCYRRVRL